jgi:hypothetical protein
MSPEKTGDDGETFARLDERPRELKKIRFVPWLAAESTALPEEF